MRTRLSALLLALMAVVLVALGVPLAVSIAGNQARAMHADRLADVTLFASLVPAAADPGRPDAARAAEVEASALQQDLERYDETYGIQLMVVDVAGRPWLASRTTPSEPVLQEQVRSAMRTALFGRLSEDSDRSMPWDFRPVVVATPVTRDGDVVGAVISVSPTGHLRSEVLRRWLVLAGAELLALGGAALLAGRLAGWLLRPVGRLDEATGQIAGGDLSARVPAGSGPPELRRLEHRFNEMAGHVQEAVEAQRAFVADASHQLRNPMAALLLRLEGLRLSAVPQSVEPTDAALNDGRNLAGILDRMLELARVDHIGASPGLIDVAALVDQRLEAWRVVARSRSITVNRLGLPQAPGVHEPGALAGAIDAVVDNSVKYSPEQSTVTVEVAAHSEFVEIIVTDDGPGVPEEELPRLAERFWRSARTAQESGTGLGMSIAKSFMERYGGRLEMARTQDRGLQVRLLVPAPPTGGDGVAPAEPARVRARVQGLVRR